MHILMPLPNQDFDPTESAVPWRMLSKAGHRVSFITPEGQVARADERMVSGKGLGPLKYVLMANAEALSAYGQMISSAEYLRPTAYDKVNPDQFDALLLPGGHAKGMKEYLESSLLQELTSQFFQKQKPIAAICHGVVLAARSKKGDAGSSSESVLRDHKTTSLLKTQEMLAWTMTAAWLGSYYRTYPETVEDEVRSVLAKSDQFVTGPMPVARDSEKNDQAGFTVQSGHYLSARWPGDAHRFSRVFLEMLSKGV